MDSHSSPQNRGRTSSKPSRRRLLAAIGTAVTTGIAGCSGGGGGSDGADGGDTTTAAGPATDTTTAGGGTGETGTATSGGGNGVQPDTCADMTESFRTVDPGNRALLFVGEFPSVVSETDYYTTRDTSVLSLATPDSTTYGRLFEATHRPGGDVYEEPLKQGQGVPPSYEALTETTFAGRTLTAYFNPSNTTKTDASAIIRLPYDYEDRVIWFENDFSVRAFTKDQGSIAGSCAENLLRSLALVIESLEVNPAADPEDP